MQERKKNKNNKTVSLILYVAIIFASSFFAPKAQAQWLVSDPGTTIQSTIDAIANMGSFALASAEKIIKTTGSHGVTAYKIAMLLVVQQAVSALIGDGDGLLIRDYGNYLYTSPHQRAMAQMNSFFNTVSKGRLSVYNYEGVGPNYDAYLIGQAKKTIAGQPFVTNLQEQVINPTQMFSGGNMKGIMTYMQCGNNVACYTLVSNAQYEKEFAKAQDIARSEQQNGFLPQKYSSGRIKSPALLAQSALMQVDQVGTQLIMNGGLNGQEPWDAVIQITEGATISTVSRLANYGIADDAGKAAIINQNNQFPFSLSYSNNGGVGLTAGGVTVKTGMGAANYCTKGPDGNWNTAACANLDVNMNGAKIDTSTQMLNSQAPNPQPQNSNPNLNR